MYGFQTKQSLFTEAKGGSFSTRPGDGVKEVDKKVIIIFFGIFIW